MALRFSENDPNLNPGEADYNRKFNDLKKAESTDATNKATGNSGTNSDVKNAEENPSNGWQNNVAGKNTLPSNGLNRLGFLKKKGPLIAIVITVTALVGGVGFIGNPAFLAQSILANLVQKYNLQETSLSIRANKLLVSKLVDGKTSGICGEKITISCKFTRPSNRFLTKLGESGITALDKEGRIIESKLLFSNTRPAMYKFTDGAGKELKIEAKELSSKLLSNAEFRAAFSSASNTRFMSLSDSVFKYIKGKFGFNVTDKLSGVKDADDVAKKVGNELDEEGRALKAASEGGKEAMEAEAKALLTKEAEASVEKIGKTGKASGIVNLGAGAICLVADTPKLFTKAVRAYQMTQLVKYSMVFLSAFGSIKAGDASPAEASAVGERLTKTVNGKSALDSFGINSVVNGSTKPSNDNYKAFAPGGSIIKKFKKYNKAVSSSVKTDACKVMTNPVTGEAINIALSGTTLVGGIINLAAGFVISEVLVTVLPPVLEAIISVIPAEKVLAFFAGDLTENISGEQIGDALSSGASHVMGQTANHGGNMPLSVDDAVAYEGLTKQVQLAYAEEDRATLSPFDISGPNTMLGSMVQMIMPYYIQSSSSVGTISNSLSVIGSIVTNSFGAILSPSISRATSTDKSQYELCDDPAIKDNDIASGAYCNVIYGVPTQYLDKDPSTVLNELIASGDIDKDSETGEPKEDSKLQAWIDMCTDGTTDLIDSCKITKKNANYALYTIDHRIQRSLDGEEAATTTTTAPTNAEEDKAS